MAAALSAPIVGIGLRLRLVQLSDDRPQLGCGQGASGRGWLVHCPTANIVGVVNDRPDHLRLAVDRLPWRPRPPVARPQQVVSRRETTKTRGVTAHCRYPLFYSGVQPDEHAKGQVSVSVKTVTRSELELRRDEILASLGQTLAEFRELSRARTLTSDEWDARTELDEISFLLGEASQ